MNNNEMITTTFIKRFGYLFLFSILFLFGVGIKQVNASQVDFSVQPMTSDYQLDKKKTYFDLKAAPGTKTQLKIKVANLIDRSLTFKVLIRDATTNYNGVVEYAESQSKVLSQQPFSVVKAVTVNQNRITVPAKSEKIVTLDVALPNTTFAGVVAGGISVIEDNDAQSQTKSERAVIDNRYLYTTAVIFHGEQPVTSAQVKLKTVDITQINARNVIAARFENQSAMFLNKVQINTQVRRLGSSKVLYRASNKDMQIAPTSAVTFPIPLAAGELLKSGTYELSAEMISKNQAWYFKQKFMVSGSKARILNEKDITIDQTNYWIYWILLLFLLIIVNVFVILWINRRLKRKYQQKN
ncbi:DUF916 and DUF3324 domain-containing protein [Dellaglioa sp. P0083]|uniref:DUF916 and DUF3324 domain-containing protein n=1 Tax=Dellaglioa kimchii TaxID=3344667 RepID=UPI0038D421D6